MRIGQHRGKQRRLVGIEGGGRLAERAARSGFNPELPVWTPLGDVEIDLEHPPFAEHKIEPYGQRKF